MAPLPELITPLGREMIDSLPPVLRDDPDTIAVLHCQAREAERLGDAVAEIRAQLSPLNATELGLPWWELLLRVPGDIVASVEARREAVMRRYRALEGDPAGSSWVLRVGRRIGDVPWTYQEHIPGDGTTPPAQTLRIHLPFAPASASWDQALIAFREEVPSELDLVFVSEGGFILDESEMDVEGMGI